MEAPRRIHDGFMDGAMVSMADPCSVYGESMEQHGGPTEGPWCAMKDAKERQGGSMESPWKA